MTDKRELERLMRKLSPAMTHFASTEAEFVHILQGCSVCSNRLAFCGPCAEKAYEFFNGFTSAELFALYGIDLPPANEGELANFAEAVAAREAQAICNECPDS
jgi:biotin carboxylase